MSIMSLAPDRNRNAASLSRLARACRDGEARYRHAADLSSMDALRELLLRFARERARFAHELEIEAQLLGGLFSVGSGPRPRVDTALLQGDAHRLEACRAGDHATLEEYERTLRSALPEELERLLRSHHAALKDALSRLENVSNALI